MKQNITIEQLNELSIANRIKLSRYFNPKDTIKDLNAGKIVTKVPLLSIGQMIEFLDEHTEGNYQIQRNGERDGWRLDSDDIDFDENGNKELCDALWEAVKEVLEST